jgi:mannose-6-phosphate isomerase-like protein (cupin superfamily)
MTQDVAHGRTAQLRASDALARLPGPDGERSVALFRHGTLTVKLYAPRGHDAQTPHTLDEVYVVERGAGTFFDGTTRRAFAAGDLIFVAAGIPHRFEDFTDDLSVWVMFYGPDGGERDPAA